MHPINAIDEEIKVKIIQNFKKQLDLGIKAPNGFTRPGVMKSMSEIMNTILDELERSTTKTYFVMELMGTDMYTYYHSVNVAIISVLTGMKLGMSRQELFRMGLGALLHDIGKTKVSPDILQKPTSLTIQEFNEMKRHPEYGYKMVQSDLTLHAITKNIIYCHHERLDASG